MTRPTEPSVAVESSTRADSTRPSATVWKHGDLVLCDPTGRDEWHLAVVAQGGDEEVYVTFVEPVSSVADTCLATPGELRPASLEQRAAFSRKHSEGAPTRVVRRTANGPSQDGSSPSASAGSDGASSVLVEPLCDGSLVCIADLHFQGCATQKSWAELDADSDHYVPVTERDR